MRKIAVVLLAGLSIILAVVFYWLKGQGDYTPPVISFSQAEFTFTEGEDRSILLNGVTALDETDGDVSETLVIESVIPMIDEMRATVIYYAKDKSNNVGKATRTIRYLTEKTKLWAEDPETEDKDGGQETGESTEESEVDSEEKESESEKDAEEKDTAAEGSPHITLKESRIKVQRGSQIDYISYVKEITDDKDEREWLWRQIHIDGRANTAVAGTYDLYYTVIDRDNHFSNSAKLTVIVE